MADSTTVEEIANAKRQLQQLGASTAVPDQWDKTTVITLSLSLLVFALIVLSLMSFLIYKNKPAQPILRTFGTLLIIVAAVFLVIVGYGEAQIAPVMGLLGTVAGYLLGKSDTRRTLKKKGKKKPKGNQEPP